MKMIMNPLLLFGLFLGVITCGCDVRDPVETFRIHDAADVDFIAIYGADSIEITRNGSEWEIGKGIAAEAVMLDNFFYAFGNLEISGATTGGSIDSLTSRKIVIREKSRTKKLRFYAGKDFYLLHQEGSARIYRIQVKGNPDADLSKVFSDRFSDWQSKLLVDFSMDEISRFEVFPGPGYGEGFVINNDNDSLVLFDLSGQEPMREGISPEKLILYSSYFGEIYFEKEISEDSIRKRINASAPFFRFIVTRKAKEPAEFRIYPLYLENGQPDFFHGAFHFKNDPSIYEVNYIYLDLLFQDKGYFSVE